MLVVATVHIEEGEQILMYLGMMVPSHPLSYHSPHLACLISKLGAAAHPTNYVTIQVRKRFHCAEINIYLLLFIIT